MKVTLELDQLSILDGNEKRALEDYVDPRRFKQRKQLDEWIVGGQVKVDVDVGDLMILSEKFIVEVCSDGVALKNTD